VVEQKTPRPISDGVLRDRYGFTAWEIETARLLATGCPDSEVAQALGIRWSTARRHPERVFGKLGAHSRTVVAARLAGAGEPQL
jgi:DNA-binding NarL/FixJ family response regulator